MDSNSGRLAMIAGGLFVLTGIVFGAFGAHALKKVLDEVQLASFETAVRYQVWHGLALILLGLITDKGIAMKWPGIFMFIGVLFFSGSIYFLLLFKTIGFGWLLSWVGPLTPIGGILLILGWSLFLVKMTKKNLKGSKKTFG